MCLDNFDLLMSKVNLKKNIILMYFQAKKNFEKQLLLQCQILF